jgi:hypothetical protein
MLLLLRSELFANISLRLNVVDRTRLDACLLAVSSRCPRVEPLQSTALLTIEDVSVEGLRALSSHCEDTSAVVDLGGAAGDTCLAEQGLLPCSLCGIALLWPKTLRCTQPGCRMFAHIVCLAMHFYHKSPPDPFGRAVLVPAAPCPCPLCRVELHWGALIVQMKQRYNASEKQRAEERRRQILQSAVEGNRRLRDLGILDSPKPKGRRLEKAGTPTDPEVLLHRSNPPLQAVPEDDSDWFLR